MMTRTGKRFLWVLLGLTLTLALYCSAASAASSGTWGDLSWELDDEGLLTISGSGSMTNFPSYSLNQAWLANKTEIITVIIQEGITSIGDYAFYGCSKLTNISIPVSVTSIGNYAFYNCSSLSSISIPDSVTSIGNSAFNNCNNLSSISIPDSVTSIGYYAFSNNTTVYVASEKSNAAKEISRSHPFRIAGTKYDLQYTFTNGEISGLKISNADKDIESVVIPEGLTDIVYSAFNGCSKLTSINIPNTVTSIGYSAFYNCSSLTGAIIIPNGVKSIENSTFYGCSSLTSISIPNSVTSIGHYAFNGCSNLTSINIPDNVSVIGDSAFSGCYSLVGNIVIPENVTSIGERVFFRCNSLNSITLSESVTTIGNYAFYGCSNLTSINIPNSVTSIGDWAFSSCSGLISISIPGSLTSIGRCAFMNCSNLTSIKMQNGITSVGDSMFSLCSNLTSINMPNSVTTIGQDAFSSCQKLKSVSIPDSVTSIGKRAFSGCINLSKITIPASVTNIEADAFNYCNLEKAVFLHTDGSTGVSFSTSNVFSATTTVYCYMFSSVDGWASGQYPVVYLDEIDINTIRSITLPDDFKLACGESRTISYTLFPDDQAPVTWTSSNSQIVSVNNGTITAHRPGIAVITATVGTVFQNVHVEAYTEATDFELSESEVWLLAKETLQLSAVSFQPAGASADITWSSSDTARATVDQNGLVTSLIPGDVIISADSQNNIHKECLVHLFYPVTAVSFSETAVSVPVGGLRALEANVTARTQSCVNHLVIFTSSNNSVASVDEEGRVHGLTLGTATITAASKSGKTATCAVTVRSANILTLPSSTITIESEAFAGLTNVDIIVIPASVTSIADDAFAGSDVIIKAPSSSYAYRWAQNHGFQVQAP